jgi:hypothetical protein
MLGGWVDPQTMRPLFLHSFVTQYFWIIEPPIHLQWNLRLKFKKLENLVEYNPYVPLAFDQKALIESDFDPMWTPWLNILFFRRSYMVGSRSSIHLVVCLFVKFDIGNYDNSF